MKVLDRNSALSLGNEDQWLLRSGYRAFKMFIEGNLYASSDCTVEVDGMN